MEGEVESQEAEGQGAVGGGQDHEPVKINQRITGYSVKETGGEGVEDEVQGEYVTDPPPRPRPIERPDEVWGRTFKLKTPVHDHAFYVTVNHVELEDGTIRPFELFINTKDPDMGAMLGILGRTASAVWRQGGDYLFLLDEWEEVYNPNGGFFVPKRGWCPSVVAYIGWTLRDHFKRLGLLGDPKNDLTQEQRQALEDHIAEKTGKTKYAVPEEDKPTTNPEDMEQEPVSHGGAEPFQCKDCKEWAVYIMDGCPTCAACGSSKCG